MAWIRGSLRRALAVTAALVILSSLGGCGGGGDGSNGSARCSDFTYQEDAQAALRAGETQLDGDHDGIACESLPHRSTTPSTPSSPSSTIVQGLFTGTLSGSSSTGFQMLSLENGDVWALYGNPSGTTFLVKGFVQGPTTRSGTAATSSSMKDFGFNPAPTGALSGSITSSSVNGSLTFGGSQVSFSGAPLVTSSYVYDTPANLALITGGWSLNAVDGTTANITVTNTGTFTGTNSGCAISGTISPRNSGKNVFDVSVTSGPTPCVAPGSVSTGIAVTYLLPGSTVRELVLAGVNAGRTAGNAFFGVR